MKAMLWEKENQLQMVELKEPVCRPSTVKIKVMSAGVCATDLHIIRGTFHNGEPPHVLGHEIAGEIVELGACTPSHFMGKRVVVETAVGCGLCEHCRLGNKHLCRQGGEIGFPPYQGGYAQYVVVPYTCVHEMPEGMTYDEGGILEAVACPVGAIRRIGLSFGQSVLIQGAGIAGLSFLQAVRACSAGKVMMTVRRKVRGEQALRLGTDVVINTIEENLEARVMEETGGRGVDLSIDAAGAAQTVLDAVKLCAAGGRVLLYGLPDAKETIHFPIKDIIMKQLTVVGLTNNELVW